MGIAADPEQSDQDPGDSVPTFRYWSAVSNVRYLVAESGDSAHPMDPRYMSVRLRIGRQGSHHAVMPMKLIIFDGESAVLGIDPDDISVGAVVTTVSAVVVWRRNYS